jgi:hypothetical protein
VTIQVVGENVEFLINEGSSPPRIRSVAVQQDDCRGPIWWIVSAEYSETWSTGVTAELLGNAADKARAHLKGLSIGTTGRALSRLTYGQVPDGFRQAVPEQGAAPKLTRHVRYNLDVLSADEGINIGFVVP